MARFTTSERRTFSGRKPYVLFLCTGNTCRSPMTYGIVKKMMEENGITGIEVRTAGVMTIPGLLPTQEVRQILEKDEIDIALHRSCQLTPEIIKGAKLILGMTSFHVQMALRMSDYARNKTFLLKEYVGFDPKNSQVQDPMGCTLEVYKKVYRELRSACKRLIKMDIFQKARHMDMGEPRLARKQARLTQPEGAPPKAAEKKPAPRKRKAEPALKAASGAPARKTAKSDKTPEKPASKAPARKTSAAKAPAPPKAAAPSAKKTVRKTTSARKGKSKS